MPAYICCLAPCTILLARATAIKYSAPREPEEFGYRNKERKVSLERKFSYRDVACLLWSSSWPRITHTRRDGLLYLRFFPPFFPEVLLGIKGWGKVTCFLPYYPNTWESWWGGVGTYRRCVGLILLFSLHLA